MSFRIKAFLIHASVSIIIALICLYVVFFLWHPYPLAKAVGVVDIFILMITIDTILGPMLTLLLAREGKKGLKFDLSLVILLQLSALTYGIHSILNNRPVWIAFDILRFELVQANDIHIDNTKNISPYYKKKNWFGPKFVAIIPPKNTKERNERTFTQIETGLAPSMQPHLYMPLSKSWSEIQKKEKKLEVLKKYNKPSDIRRVLTNQEITGWLPLTAYNKPMVVLLNTKQKKIVNIVQLKPYP